MVLALTLMFGLIVLGNNNAEAVNNPYPVSQTYNGKTTIPCTRVAWQEAYDRLGMMQLV